MSLKLDVGRSVSEETRKVANAAFPKGNVYLWIGDELGELYADPSFIDYIQCADNPRSRRGGRL